MYIIKISVPVQSLKRMLMDEFAQDLNKDLQAKTELLLKNVNSLNELIKSMSTSEEDMPI